MAFVTDTNSLAATNADLAIVPTRFVSLTRVQSRRAFIGDRGLPSHVRAFKARAL